jgi:hypothetical protein
MAEDLRPNAAHGVLDFRALSKLPLPIAAMTAIELDAVAAQGHAQDHRPTVAYPCDTPAAAAGIRGGVGLGRAGRRVTVS